MKNFYLSFYLLFFLLLGHSSFAQPANDDCTNAIAIGTVVDLDFSTIDATTDGPEHPNDCVSIGSTPTLIYKDIWYVFTPNFTGTASFSTCSTADFDTKIVIYAPGFSCPPTDGELLACNEDGPGCNNSTSLATFEVESGMEYLLRLGGYGDGDPGESGEGTFTVQDFIPQPGPPNDNCEDAQDLVLDADDFTMIEFSTMNANTDGPMHEEETSCFDANETNVYNDVWYTWTSTFDGFAEWSNCGTSNFDSRMAIYGPNSSCQPDPNELIGCSDDGVDANNVNCAGFTSRATFPVANGATYILRIGGWSSSDQGTGTFTLKKVPPPIIPENDNCLNYDTAFVMTAEQADAFDFTFEGFTSNGSSENLPDPQCRNTGEFVDVWYRFNSGFNTELELRFKVQTVGSSFVLDLFQNCGIQLDTAGAGFCLQTDDFNNSFITTSIDGFPGEPRDYLLRVSTRITTDQPGAFFFQWVGEPLVSIPELELTNFSLSPNPTEDLLYLQFDLPQEETIQVDLVNTLGKSVRHYPLGKRASGPQHIELSTAELAPGIYFLRLWIGGQQKTVRVVKG
ncbi:MAG: T9SS type A sorting domain-containing protein [Bacteroidota bacterium]